MNTLVFFLNAINTAAMRRKPKIGVTSMAPSGPKEHVGSPAGLFYCKNNIDIVRFVTLDQGCQTYFHLGPYQHYGCPQRASCNN